MNEMESELTKHYEGKSGGSVSKYDEDMNGDDIGEYSKGGHYRGDVKLGPRKKREEAYKCHCT